MYTYHMFFFPVRQDQKDLFKEHFSPLFSFLSFLPTALSSLFIPCTARPIPCVPSHLFVFVVLSYVCYTLAVNFSISPLAGWLESTARASFPLTTDSSRRNDFRRSRCFFFPRPVSPQMTCPRPCVPEKPESQK